MNRHWAIDIEGNGANPPEIVELAIVEMDGRKLTGNFKSWRFRPTTPITPIVTRIHGITNDDVADEPLIEEVIDDIFLWIEDCPIVGHNVRVELDALTSVLPDWAPTAAYDTLKLARLLLPEQKKYGLEALGVALNLTSVASLAIGGGSAHSAPYDAAMSAILFDKLLEPLSQADQEDALARVDITLGQQGSFL
jgi:DNA polymerase III epsilon subunit-like protein